VTVYSPILMAVILWRPTGLPGVLTDAIGASSPPLPRGPERSDGDATRDPEPQQAIRRLRAVQDVSFSVKENETVALIGPNGAEDPQAST